MLYLVMALHGVAHDSGTYDEFVHVTAGYSYWAFDDYRLNPENGNLAQRIVALPLVAEAAMSHDVAGAFPSRDQTAWHAGDMWTLSDQFFFGAGRDADALLFPARAATAVVGALLGLLVFFWARSLFGSAGAAISLALYVFSPTMLAHGALATSDMIGAAFFTAALWATWRVFQRVTPGTLGASLLAFSGLLVAKPSAPVIVPIVLVMIAAQLASRRPIALAMARRERSVETRGGRARVIAALIAAHLAAGFVAIWAAYGFRYAAFAPGSAPSDSFFEPWSSMLDTPGLTTSLAGWGRAHHVLPEAYLYGLATVVAYARDRISFLNGVITLGGSHAFFPYAGLVKTTIPGLLLILIAILGTVWRWRAARGSAKAGAASAIATTARARAASGIDAASARWTPAPSLYELTPLLAGVAIYGGVAVASSLNIGHRHLLPIVPAVMILVGAVGPLAFAPREDRTGARRSMRAMLPRGRRAVAAAAVGLLVLWHAGESLAVSPHYLAYFNELAGGPSEGYRHLVDSSLDWGQDLPSLAAWLDDHGLRGGSGTPIYLSYFGTARPAYYHIDATLLPGFPDRWTPRHPEPLRPGIYCFSATMLQGLYFMTPGAWSDRYERDYQSMRYNLRLFDSTAASPSAREALIRQTGERFWVTNFQVFEHLRAARLAAYLRRRDPDAEVGYSILIYRVNDEELSRALLGPAPQ